MPQPHVTRLEHRVSLIHVDTVQIHFSSYFGWMDLCFQALLEDLEHPIEELFAEGHGLPMVDASCNFRRPVGLGARLTSLTSIVEAGQSSLVFEHEFSDAGGVVAVARGKHVWVNLRGSQAAELLPGWLRSAARQLDPASIAE